MFRFLEWLEAKLPRKEELPIFSLAFALLLSYLAERFGVSGIIGAYIAGLVVGNTKQGKFIKNKIDVLVYMLFSPMFFCKCWVKTHHLIVPSLHLAVYYFIYCHYDYQQNDWKWSWC